MCIETALEYVGCGHRDIDFVRCEATKKSGKDHRRGRGLREGDTVEKEGKCAECVAKAEDPKPIPVTNPSEKNEEARKQQPKSSRDPDQKIGAETKVERGLDMEKLIDVDDNDEKQKQPQAARSLSKAQHRDAKGERASRTTKQRYQNDLEEQKRETQAEKLQRRFFGPPPATDSREIASKVQTSIYYKCLEQIDRVSPLDDSEIRKKQKRARRLGLDGRLPGGEVPRSHRHRAVNVGAAEVQGAAQEHP